MNKSSITNIITTTILLSFTLNTWANEKNEHHYVEVSAIQVNKGNDGSLYGGVIESQHVIINNIFLHGAYKQYKNTDVNVNDYLFGIGLWIEPTDNISITGYAKFKKINLDGSTYREKVNIKGIESIFGTEIKYRLSDAFSLVSQFDVSKAKITWNLDDKSYGEFSDVNNSQLYRFSLGVKGKLKKISYEIKRNYHRTENDNLLQNNDYFSRNQTIIAKISYHFTDKFSLGINRESTDKNAINQFSVRYTL